MFHRKRFILALGLVLAVASSAQADLRNYTATLQIDLLGITVSSTKSGTVNVAPDGSFSLGTPLFNLDAILSTPAPGVAFFTLTGANSPGSFSPVGSGFGGQMAVTGSAYFSFATGRTLSVPLNVIGGVPAGSTLLTNAAGNVTGTIGGGPWTTGVAKVMNGLVTVASQAGFDNRTANGKGAIQLVTPILFSVSGTTLDGTYGTFGLLDVNFTAVPEPGTALLIGAGLMGLGALGSRRRA